jgi:hypothetical protein
VDGPRKSFRREPDATNAPFRPCVFRRTALS